MQIQEGREWHAYPTMYDLVLSQVLRTVKPASETRSVKPILDDRNWFGEGEEKESREGKRSVVVVGLKELKKIALMEK